MCADCPNPCKDGESCRKVFNSGEMDNEPRMMKEEESDFDHRDVGICQKGCGLLLSHTDIVQGNHCCLDALRMLNDTLQERSATLEHEGRMQRLRWGRREQSLLAQVSFIQSEAQLTALKYQRKLHQYMLNINNIAEQVIGYYKQPIQSDSGAPGVCVSQVSEQGPADAVSELQDLEEHGGVPEVNHHNTVTQVILQLYCGFTCTAYYSSYSCHRIQGKAIGSRGKPSDPGESHRIQGKVIGSRGKPFGSRGKPSDPGESHRIQGKAIGSRGKPSDPGKSHWIQGKAIGSRGKPSDPGESHRIQGKAIGSRGKPSDPGESHRIQGKAIGSRGKPSDPGESHQIQGNPCFENRLYFYFMLKAAWLLWKRNRSCDGFSEGMGGDPLVSPEERQTDSPALYRYTSGSGGGDREG
ncbi:unnamed protein product, partial [Coregonus sp. 'balchen']